MNRDDILRMAKEAGFVLGYPFLPVHLERFAALVVAAELQRLHAINAELVEALRKAEAALADIGDADREPGDDVAWCEARAAEPLSLVRAALAKAEGV